MAIAEVATGAGLFKTVMDTLKGFKDIGDANIRNTVAIELQSKILAAYQDQLALTERVSALEKEIANMKTWEAEKHRYELKDIGGRGYAYIVKGAVRGTEPPHAICANCYEHGEKSILQFNGEPRLYEQAFACPSCRTEFNFYKSTMDAVLQG